MSQAPSDVTREHRLAALRVAGIEPGPGEVSIAVDWLNGDGKPLALPLGIDFDRLAAALARPDIFLRDMAENLRARARGLAGEERYAAAHERENMAEIIDRIRAEMAKGVPFAQSKLYVEPR